MHLRVYSEWAILSAWWDEECTTPLGLENTPYQHTAFEVGTCYVKTSNRAFVLEKDEDLYTLKTWLKDECDGAPDSNINLEEGGGCKLYIRNFIHYKLELTGLLAPVTRDYVAAFIAYEDECSNDSIFMQPIVIHEDEVDTCMPLLDNSYSDYSTKNADGSYNLKTYEGGECEGDPLYEYTFENIFSKLLSYFDIFI